MSSFFLPLHSGTKGFIAGLQGSSASELYGSFGILRDFDNESGRWEVKTEKAGFEKAKLANIFPLNFSMFTLNSKEFPP